jgi:hypothetical protein
MPFQRLKNRERDKCTRRILSFARLPEFIVRQYEQWLILDYLCLKSKTFVSFEYSKKVLISQRSIQNLRKSFLCRLQVVGKASDRELIASEFLEM